MGEGEEHRKEVGGETIDGREKSWKARAKGGGGRKGGRKARDGRKRKELS